MDCDMPVMNGFDAAKQILTRAKNEKKKNELLGKPTVEPIIVALTGDYTQMSIKLSQEAGMQSILQKPFKITELKELL